MRKTLRRRHLGSRSSKADFGKRSTTFTGEGIAKTPTLNHTAWLESSISNYELLAKSLVGHRAEKGRIVESVVKTALRAILPGRFSIGTGFAITRSGKQSSQLDLVIYDALQNAPIILQGGTGLFPIESIYGFVEVKSDLNSQGINDSLRTIGEIREFSKEKLYMHYGKAPAGNGKMAVDPREFCDGLSPRSFIFAVGSRYSSISTLERRLQTATNKHRAHLHGLAVLNRGWFIGQKAFQKTPRFKIQDDQAFAFASFCATVLHSIRSFEMHPASMDRYLGLQV